MMESLPILLSAVAAGGLIGAGDQYLALLLISGASRLGLVELPSQMMFMEHPVFIGVVVVFWIITVAPAYSTVLAPGVMNAVNTVANFISGFVVPLSAALVSLASIGIIINIHPDLALALEAIGIFSGVDLAGTGAIAGTENILAPAALLVAAGGAITATTLTGTKALAKPALSTVKGTLGTVSAPIYATLENLASIMLMGLLYVLAQVDPRLIFALFVIVALAVFVILAFTLYQLWRLKKGIGRVLYLAQTQPKIGLSLVAEVFIWGSGWIGWNMPGRGLIMFLAWLLWLATLSLAIPGLTAALAGLVAVFPPLAIIPAVMGLGMTFAGIMLGLLIGLWSSRALLLTLERQGLVVEELAGGLAPVV